MLIVDDEPLNLDILETRLATQGYEILTAADGEEALQSAESAEPDLILLDVNMPRLNGFKAGNNPGWTIRPYSASAAGSWAKHRGRQALPVFTLTGAESGNTGGLSRGSIYPSP